MATDKNDNTLQIGLDGQESTVVIHRAPLAQASRCHCDNYSAETEKGCSEEDPRPEKLRTIVKQGIATFMIWAK